MEHHPGERIVEARVETARNDDEIRLEALQRGNDHALESGEIGADATARRHGNVEIVAFARSFAVGADRTGAGRKGAVLMDRNRQHVTLAPENMLGAVAVMNVPI